MLSVNSDGRSSDALKRLLSERLISIVFQKEAHSRAKPAFQALDFFLDKGLLPVATLLSTLGGTAGDCAIDDEDGAQNGDICGSPHLGCLAENTTLPISPRPGGAVERRTPRYERLASELASRCLIWISHPDVAPAAGKAVVAFYNQIRKHPSNALVYYLGNSGAPIWVDVVHRSVRAQPGALDAFKQHLFPDLFGLEVVDMRHQLTKLDLLDILRGHDLGDEFQSRFLFSVLHVGKDLGFVVEPGKSQIGGHYQRVGRISFGTSCANLARDRCGFGTIVRYL
jgi:hypothetical protein